jgi:hypothetical protein
MYLILRSKTYFFAVSFQNQIIQNNDLATSNIYVNIHIT